MAKKANSKTRNCIDCNADISDRGLTAKRCVSCAEIRKAKLKEKNRDKQSGKEKWNYIEKRKADSVTGEIYGITKKQKGFIVDLLNMTEYNYSEILILADRDGKIKVNDKIANIENLSVNEASKIIAYLIDIHEYLEL